MSWKKKFRKAVSRVAGLGNPMLAVAGLGGRGKTKERHLKDQLGAAVPAELGSQLQEEMTSWKDMPTRIKTSQIDAAKRAGTFAETPEFNAGLTSDVKAQERGARLEAVRRMNALRRRLGLQEGDETFYNAQNA